MCRTAANVEYQRGDRSSIDDARLSKSIEFDPPHYIAAHMQIWPKIVKDAHRPTCSLGSSVPRMEMRGRETPTSHLKESRDVGGGSHFNTSLCERTLRLGAIFRETSAQTEQINGNRNRNRQIGGNVEI